MRNEIAVGILFFTALSILGYYTLIMSGDFFSKNEYYKMSVTFYNSDGLEANSKVKINGVLSGSVVDVKLMPDNSVFVTLKMYNKFILYSNYKIMVKNETMLGGKYIGIDPGSGYKDGKAYAVVEARTNLLGESLGDVLTELSGLVAENRANLYKTIKNISEITAKINSGQGTLGQLINENKVYKNADDLIKEVRESMEDAREQAPITSFIRAALMAF